MAAISSYVNSELIALDSSSGRNADKKGIKQKRSDLFNIVFQLNLISSKFMLYIMPTICTNLTVKSSLLPCLILF